MYPYVNNLEELKKHPKFPFVGFAKNKEEYLLSNLHWLYLCKPYIKQDPTKWENNPDNPFLIFEDYKGEGEMGIETRLDLRNLNRKLAVYLAYVTNDKETMHSAPYILPYFSIGIWTQDDEMFEAFGTRHVIGIDTDLGNPECEQFLQHFLQLIFVDQLPVDQLTKAIDAHQKQYDSQYFRFGKPKKSLE